MNSNEETSSVSMLAALGTIGKKAKKKFSFKRTMVRDIQQDTPSGFSSPRTTTAGLDKAPKALPIIGRLSWQGQYRFAISAVAITLAASAGLGFVANSLTVRLNDLRQSVQGIEQVVLRLQGEVKSASNGNSDSFVSADKSIIEALTQVSRVANYARLDAQQQLALPPVEATANWNDSLWEVLAKPHLDYTERITKVLALLDSYGVILNREPQFSNFSNAGQQLYQSTLDADAAYESALKLGVKDEGLNKTLDVLKLASKDFIASGGVEFNFELFDGARAKAIEQVGALLKAQKDPSGKAAVALSEVASRLGADMGTEMLNLTSLATSVKQSSDNITNSLPVLMGEVTKQTRLVIAALEQPMETPSPLVGFWALAAFLLVMSALELSLLLLINSKQSAFAAYTARQEQLDADEDVRQAIDELDPIADGDLTARLTIRDNTLTTVADRVNVTMENMQDAMVEVKAATRKVESTIEQIFEYSEDSREITDMASVQAQASRVASEEGVRAVQIASERTMKQRSSMQDVAKRVKHLGEVTQSITSVVDLIEAIASRTEVLALNTSLRAADAGTEGAAFRVISNEIQNMTTDIKRRLNDIVLSVKAVQTETQSVIANVEGVTAELVDSTKYWEEARTSLEMINKVAQEVDSLIKRVRDSNEVQTQAASSAVTVMGKLSESTSKFRTSASEA